MPVEKLHRDERTILVLTPHRRPRPHRLAGVPDARLTGPGAAIGTIAYMAPEQALGHDVDARGRVFVWRRPLRNGHGYVLTRPHLAGDRLAYFGVSMGARLGAISLAVEQRFRAAVLWSGGLPLTTRLPEIDEINFAPRVRTPVLMLNGREDFTFPIDTSQAPMFRWLGTAEADKRYVPYEGGHVFPFARVMKDTLDWLDQYLGPVK